MTYIDEELAHYGVRGMKWGVRRAEKRAAKDAAARAGAPMRKEEAQRLLGEAHKKFESTSGIKKFGAGSQLRDARIKGARITLEDHARDVKDSRRTYKSIKKESGRKSAGAKEAKRILNEKKSVYITELNWASEKTGSEFALGLLADLAKPKGR